MADHSILSNCNRRHIRRIKQELQRGPIGCALAEAQPFFSALHLWTMELGQPGTEAGGPLIANLNTIQLRNFAIERRVER
jgi:predicted secreted hydrolase